MGLLPNENDKIEEKLFLLRTENEMLRRTILELKKEIDELRILSQPPTVNTTRYRKN